MDTDPPPSAETPEVPTATAKPAKRAPRSAASQQPPELPAFAHEVTDLASLSRVVSLLSACIVEAVHAGKSVTAPNKRLIVVAADETRRAMSEFVRRADSQPSAPATQSPGPLTTEPPTTPTASLTTEPSSPSIRPRATPPAPTFSAEATTGLKRELMACVRDELGKLRAELSRNARQSHVHDPSEPSYAQVTRSKSKPAPAPTAKSTPPPTRPAIIVAAKADVSSRQQTVEAFRRSISFRTSDYAPVRVQPVSNSRLRVEFETPQQRDDALLRMADTDEVTAERARALRPMLLLKGISKATPREELVGAIRAQNGCANSDLKLVFVRNNRNEALYNAVLSASPEVWRKLVGLGRVCVDHQRVHVEQFSPFLQCFSCLQFGHVRKNCRPDAVKPCALCASTAHQETDCPNKENGGSPRCYNCSNVNAKFNGCYPTGHKATSSSCPVVRAMRARVESRVDYGSA